VLTASNALKIKDDATDTANRDAAKSASDAEKDAVDEIADDYDASEKAKSADASKSRKDKVDALKTHTETVANAALTALEAKAVEAKAGADKVAAAAAKDVVDKATSAFTIAAKIGSEAVAKAVKDATAKGNEAVGAAQKNLEMQVDAARREVTRVEGLTLAQLNPQDASTVSSGTTWLQSVWSWIGRQWEGFSSSLVGQILIVATLAAITALAIAFASPFIATALLIGFAALTLGNIAIATYENYAVKGQSFGQALWGGIVEGSVVGTMFEAITNYDLTTLTYQGNSWQERLQSGGMALAQLAAARYGAKFGKWGAHKLNILPCFPAGTPIRTLHSSVAIEDLKVGDIVLSRDEFDSGAAVAGRRVEAVFVRRATVMSIGVGGRIIETTEEHPFWVVGKGWTAANAMRVGDRLLTATGEPLLIESVGESRREATVYNFRVEEWHTYFVGDPIGWGFDVWVHNTHAIGDLRYNSSGQWQQLKASNNGAGPPRWHNVKPPGDYVVTPMGTTIKVPAGYVAVQSQNGKGIVLLPKGQSLKDNRGIIRYSDPSPGNKTGAIRYYNKDGQPLNPKTGKSGTQDQTHIPENYSGEFVGYPK